MLWSRCYGRREWIGGASGVVDCIPQRGLQSDAGLEEALDGWKPGLLTEGSVNQHCHGSLGIEASCFLVLISRHGTCY